MNVEFPTTISGEAKINVFSISGQKVFSQMELISPIKKTKINLSELSSGVYLVNLQVNQFSANWKIIKK